MKQQFRIVLEPQFMKTFSCIGAACEDSCCESNWNIFIDKKTYKKYQKVNDSALKKVLQSSIKRIKKDPDDFKYAAIQKTSTCACPLLTEDKLCSVQTTLGADALSDTCALYPRVFNNVNRNLERSLTLSCPEAVRQVLLPTEPMSFNQFEETVTKENSRLRTNRIVNSDKGTRLNGAETYFWDIRIFSIQLLQNRAYSLDERMIGLGFFYHKLDEYIAQNKVDDIPSLIGLYTQLVETGELFNSIKEMKAHRAVKMDAMSEAILLCLDFVKASPRYQECYNGMYQGFQLDVNQTPEEIEQAYEQAYSQHFQPFLKNHEHMLENYLVHYVFTNLVPFDHFSTVMESYLLAVIHYVLVKVNLIGMSASYQEKFSSEHVIHLIQSLTKAVDHNTLALRSLHELFHKKGYHTLSHMALLIKD